ncbi:hypothetical protein EYF80_054932 [Liparis tanakae]|uniref:Uncharacterized protein n=1 Tax=Liparis tanakae TaxID=230148 RepID=A0A4Z2F1Z4_9TELE|nr:hypothetical protein EYF80_054932 [Liparis tanakae]
MKSGRKKNHICVCGATSSSRDRGGGGAGGRGLGGSEGSEGKTTRTAVCSGTRGLPGHHHDHGVFRDQRSARPPSRPRCVQGPEVCPATTTTAVCSGTRGLPGHHHDHGVFRDQS